MRKNTKSANKVLYTLTTIVIVAILYFGARGFMEREVVLAAIHYISESDANNVQLKMAENIFVSRPMVCEPEDDKNIDLVSYRLINSDFMRPIYLGALEGIVPIVSKNDTKKLYRAGYNWEAEDFRTVWVSRVGVSPLFSQATICFRSSDSPHGWGSLFFLVRIGVNWKVVDWSDRAGWKKLGTR